MAEDEGDRRYNMVKAAFERALIANNNATTADINAYLENIGLLLEKGALHLRALAANINEKNFPDNPASNDSIALFANTALMPLALATRNADRLVRAHSPTTVTPVEPEGDLALPPASGNADLLAQIIEMALPLFAESRDELSDIALSFETEKLRATAFKIRTATEIIQEGINRFSGMGAPEFASRAPAPRN